MSLTQIRKNIKYNAERKVMDELAKRDFKRDKAIEKIYQQSTARIQNQIDSFYLKYASNNGLSKAEVMKLVSKMDVTKFQDAAKLAVKTRDFSDEANYWLKIYNLKMKTNRLELMKAEINLELLSMTEDISKLSNAAMMDEAMREYKRQAGILGNSVGRPAERLQAVIDADFYGKNFSERIWGRNGLYHQTQQDVFSSLSRIYTDMSGYKTERTRLMKRFDVSRGEAQRLLRTEVARINSQVQEQSLKDAEFTHYVYVAEPGACKLCAYYDGMLIPLEDAEIGVNLKPLHPNCRCSAYGVIKMERKDGTSSADEYRKYKVYE